MLLVQLLGRTEWRFLKKLKIELPYDPAIPLLGICPAKNMVQKDTCPSMFIDRGMDKEDVHIYNGILPSHLKSEIMPFAAT